MDYNTFKLSLSQLEKLQLFKIPFTRFYEEFVFNYGLLDISDDSMCEFYLIPAEKEAEYTDLDQEIQETANKLAQLLTIKEQQLKENLK